MLLTSQYNRDLVERHPNASVEQGKIYASNQEPVFGFRCPAKCVSQGDIALIGSKVDQVFRQTITELD